jgi:hypothetical protein
MNLEGCGGSDEVIMAKFEILSQHLPGGTEENHQQAQDGCSLVQNLNLGHHKYERGILVTFSGKGIGHRNTTKGELRPQTSDVRICTCSYKKSVV